MGKNETLLKKDYLKLHPEMIPRQAPPQTQQIEICYGLPCPSLDGLSPSNDTTTTKSISEVSEEEYHTFLKDIMKMSDKEIEEMVQQYYPDPNSSTQSFFLPIL